MGGSRCGKITVLISNLPLYLHNIDVQSKDGTCIERLKKKKFFMKRVFWVTAKQGSNCKHFLPPDPHLSEPIL